MKVKTIIPVLLFISLYLFGCHDASTNSDPESPSKNSVIGRIVDKASNLGSSGTLVKIVNDQNAYQVNTDAGGNFSFINIDKDEYRLIVVGSSDSRSVSDTIGIYSSTDPDWGDIYAELFASIQGKIIIEGSTDHSFVSIQLLGTDKSAITTNQGNFRIDLIFPGLYDLYISVEDENYASYHFKDLTLAAGDIYIVDTVLTYKFKRAELRVVSDINLPTVLRTNFAYADGKYWYGKSIKGIYSYDPISEAEKRVFNHYFLGDPRVVYDYDDGIWSSGDQATTWMIRKYSISQAVVTDSLPVPSGFSVYSLAWDMSSNSLISHAISAMELLMYSLSTKELTTLKPNLQYDPREYDSIRFYDILVEEGGKVYTLVRYKPKDLDEELHLYIFDNLSDLNTLNIYKIPGALHNRLSYKEGKLYIIKSGGEINEIILN